MNEQIQAYQIVKIFYYIVWSVPDSGTLFLEGKIWQ